MEVGGILQFTTFHFYAINVSVMLSPSAAIPVHNEALHCLSFSLPHLLLVTFIPRGWHITRRSCLWRHRQYSKSTVVWFFSLFLTNFRRLAREDRRLDQPISAAEASSHSPCVAWRYNTGYENEIKARSQIYDSRRRQLWGVYEGKSPVRADCS